MEFLAGVLVAFAATIFFWPAIAIGLLITLYIFDHRPFSAAVLVAVLGVALYVAFADHLPDFKLWHVLAIAAGYFAIGMVWSIAKWYLLNRDVRNVINGAKAKWVETHKDHPPGIFTSAYGEEMVQLDNKGNSRTPAEDATFDYYGAFLRSFVENVGKLGRYNHVSRGFTFHQVISQLIPRAANNKLKITVWIAYWPLSMIGYFVRDFLTHVVEFIYARISGVFSRITRSMFREYE